MRLLGIVLLLVFSSICHGGLFSWLFKTKTKKEQPDDSSGVASQEVKQEDNGVVTDIAISVKIPFELRSSDEKFLREANAYTSLELSELDVCHHKVILGLQTSCAELSEEELSKVAVNLLNCQSVAESRPIYPCTSDMTLAECTKDMTPSTWNAYHIVSNRARAVCYASRQEQFGAKTQMAVNLLMYTAEEQIKSMSVLQESQESLGRSTSETLESLSEGHENLRQQQQQLSTAHHAIHTFVSSNLRELAREKKLIASGQRELAHITESIKRKLDEAKQQLLTQETHQKETHSVILQDLSTIQDNALEVWQKLDACTQKIMTAHEETIQQYGKLTDNLQRMNETVHHLMDVLQSTKRGVEDKLSWISSFLGGTDNTIQKVYSCVLHAGYFFIGMVSASFLKVPYFTRLALVVVVPLNAVAEVKHDSSLQFSTLTTIMALCILMNFTFSFIWGIYKWQKKQNSSRNRRVHQLVLFEPSATTPPPSVIKLTNLDEEKTPINTQEMIRSLDISPVLLNSSSVSSNMKTVPSGDCSSNVEFHTVTPLKNSFVRRRILGGTLGTFGSSRNSDDHDEFKESSTTTLKTGTTDLKRCAESTDKIMSSVRRHLLDELNSTASSVSNHNLSLDSKVLENSSSIKGTPASRSGTPSRSLISKNPCASLCKNGQLCRNIANEESLYCYRHRGSRKSTPLLKRGSRESTPIFNRASRESTPFFGS